MRKAKYEEKWASYRIICVSIENKLNTTEHVSKHNPPRWRKTPFWWIYSFGSGWNQVAQIYVMTAESTEFWFMLKNCLLIKGVDLKVRYLHGVPDGVIFRYCPKFCFIRFLKVFWSWRNIFCKLWSLKLTSVVESLWSSLPELFWDVESLFRDCI